RSTRQLEVFQGSNVRCSRCGAENRAGARFCDACGVALAEASSGSAAPSATDAVDVRVNLQGVGPELPEGERKTFTALFADIKGSMELMRDLDPEEARAIVDPALKIMIDAVRRYEGYVVQSTGDGIFALFGAPLAHEDHPQRAVDAALDIQKALREETARIAAKGKPGAEARMGSNSGTDE